MRSALGQIWFGAVGQYWIGANRSVGSGDGVESSLACAPVAKAHITTVIKANRTRRIPLAHKKFRTGFILDLSVPK